MQTSDTATTPVRITFPIADIAQGKQILTHLTEECLVAGGTVIHAEALNWIGGKMTEKNRLEVSAYTTYKKLPALKSRVEIFFDVHGEVPTISQFMMTNEKKETQGWIERNVQG